MGHTTAIDVWLEKKWTWAIDNFESEVVAAQAGFTNVGNKLNQSSRR